MSFNNIPSNWLITGGCGFIGVNLIKFLTNNYKNINIRIIDNLSVGNIENLSNVTNFKEILYQQISNSPTGVELIIADIREFEACLKCCEGIDIVVHLAANTGVIPSIENPRKDLDINIIGIFNLLEASRLNQTSKFIFASSGATIGEATPPINEKIVASPVSPYGASKLAGEAYCSAYYKTFGLKTVSLRFSNVYGPGSKHKKSVIAKFFNQALSGKSLEIFGDGTQTRDFIYIDDIIQAIILSAKTSIGGEVFQIATSKETTIKEIATKIKSLVESFLNQEVKIFYSNFKKGEVKRNYSDISKAKKILGYKPKYNLDKGLKHTFEYFKKIYENVSI